MNLETINIQEEEQKAWTGGPTSWQQITNLEKIAMGEEEIIWASSTEELLSKIELPEIPTNFSWTPKEWGSAIDFNLTYTGTDVHELLAYAQTKPTINIFHNLEDKLKRLYPKWYPTNYTCWMRLIDVQQSTTTTTVKRQRKIKRGELHHEHRVAIINTLMYSCQAKVKKYKDILNIRIRWTEPRDGKLCSYNLLTMRHIRHGKVLENNYFNMIPRLFGMVRELYGKPIWRRSKGWRALMRELKPAIPKMKSDRVKRPLGICLERECRELGI